MPEALRQFSDYRMLLYAVVLILVMLATHNIAFRTALDKYTGAVTKALRNLRPKKKTAAAAREGDAGNE